MKETAYFYKRELGVYAKSQDSGRSSQNHVLLRVTSYHSHSRNKNSENSRRIVPSLSKHPPLEIESNYLRLIRICLYFEKTIIRRECLYVCVQSNIHNSSVDLEMVASHSVLRCFT